MAHRPRAGVVVGLGPGSAAYGIVCTDDRLNTSWGLGHPEVVHSIGGGHGCGRSQAVGLWLPQAAPGSADLPAPAPKALHVSDSNFGPPPRQLRRRRSTGRRDDATRPRCRRPAARSSRRSSWRPCAAARRARIAAQFWTEVLWYQSVGFSGVFTHPDRHEGPARRRRWSADGGDRLVEHPLRLPQPADLRPVARHAGHGALPRARRADAPHRDDRRSARHRALRRPVGGDPVGHLPAVAQRQPVRHRPTRSSASTSASSSSTCRGSTSSSRS